MVCRFGHLLVDGLAGSVAGGGQAITCVAPRNLAARGMALPLEVRVRVRLANPNPNPNPNSNSNPNPNQAAYLPRRRLVGSTPRSSRRRSPRRR